MAPYLVKAVVLAALGLLVWADFSARSSGPARVMPIVMGVAILAVMAAGLRSLQLKHIHLTVVTGFFGAIPVFYFWRAVNTALPGEYLFVLALMAVGVVLSNIMVTGKGASVRDGIFDESRIRRNTRAAYEDVI